MDGEHCVKKAYEHILNSDFEGAIYWFEQAIAMEPSNASYYNKCAISCVRSGRWAKANNYAIRALELEPHNSEYLYHLHTINARLLLIDADAHLAKTPPNLEEALPLVQEAAKLDPLCFKAFYSLGAVYDGLGRWDEAAASIREAIRLDPAHAAARTLFAAINRKRRMLKKNNGDKPSKER